MKITPECIRPAIPIAFVLIFNVLTESLASTACDKSRKVFEGVTSGVIRHGIDSNYTQDSHCEWLIKTEMTDNSSNFITLKFHSLKTECSYDYIFVYDGNSYDSRLIGSFSGQTDPQDVTAISGSMLIMLYSDTNYVLDGFLAEFSITSCLNNCSNHGLCLDRSCLCTGDWIGEDCSVKACNCGDDEKRGFCDVNRCVCLEDYSGQTCTLRKYSPEPSQWHWITNSSRSFTKRAAHTAVYHEHTDSLFVFGGYDLNTVLGALEVFKFDSNTWKDEHDQPIKLKRVSESKTKAVLKDVLLDDNLDEKRNLGVLDQFWFRAALLSHVQTPSNDQEIRNERNRSRIQPPPRYGHAACAINDSFVIYGGKLANGKLSSDLWLFNISTREWTLRAAQSRISPPKLTRHTLTLVTSNGFVYLFGGALESGEFSSRMFRIRLLNDDDQWEEVLPRGGKTFDYRVVAHTTNFHPQTNSLIVYGGIIVNLARLSKLSDRIFSFSIDDQHWTEIFYPKSVLREMSVPRERAFHTTTIAGNYLIVFGGYSHRHNKEEICYDNQMYLYHLGCHAWINQEALGANRSSYPKKQGVFAHALVLRGDNTLLLIGGYHGNVNNDLLAFTLPDMMIPSKNLTESEKCMDYKVSSECIANPQCGWCSSDASCYGRSMSNCFTNLQTTRCPGICSALRDCQSCLVHGSAESTPAVANKLPIGKCTWCVQNAKCHQKNDYEPCGESDSVEKIGYQWWGRSGTEISNKTMCTKLDKPPGLMYLRYFHPFNWNVPDYVSMVNSTLVDFTGTILLADAPANGEVVARLRGYLHFKQIIQQENSKDFVKVCGSYAQVSLKVAVNGESSLAANFSTDQNHCVSSTWTKWDQQRVQIDLEARRKLSDQSSQQHFTSKVGLQNNVTKAFTFEFLEPFSEGKCGQYDNCLLCLSDVSCGWCDLKHNCVSRDVNETSECKIGSHWRYLTLQPSQCVNCSNFIACEDCTESGGCEWSSDETRCTRVGRFPTSVKKVNECPSACFQRNNCTSCLREKGRCVWCEDQQTCFSFSVYISEFQFGLCREWIDQSLAAPAAEAAKSLEHHQCKSCSALKNCTTCLRSLGCGWCFYKNNPIEGACVQGDFNNSSVECSQVLNSSEPMLYNYESCPDVDECGLEIHDCHANADCTNTHGSFYCKCRKGFVGDGKHRCDKTCIETCHHGRCSNYPDYNCICDLGWTGIDCSINCGCNNHSTCKTGLGTCDECQDYTEGDNCEKCVVGSYGNATSTTGCVPCNCNGHADAEKGHCDIVSGKCFCLDHTEGMHCDACTKNYYGEPHNGGQCYLQCQSRAILDTLGSQGIGSYQAAAGTKECLWILKLNESLIAGSLIQLELKETEMNVSCYNNAIYVYNNIPEFSQTLMQKRLTNVACRDSNFPKVIEEAKTGQLTVYFRRGINNEGFNAVISVLNCKMGTCRAPHSCNTEDFCVCPLGTSGTSCETETCPSNCSASLKQGECDKINHGCNCVDGFGGEDCSRAIKPSSIIMTELFSTETVKRNLNHLKKTLPRFGHTVNSDRRGFLWIFGGYSLVNGALNDIRQFDTKNHTWMQVTVDGSDSKMPVGRYFHASEVSKQSIYTYGGLSNEIELLHDFWVFNIQEQRWTEQKTEGGPGYLSGHSLTLVKIGDRESLFLIGGYSNETKSTKFSLVWEFTFGKTWKQLNATGIGPALIFGHSTVFHATSQVLYVFGGYQMVNEMVEASKRLFSLSYVRDSKSWTWSALPVFSEINRPEENLPRTRFLHSAISFSQYMIVYGGESLERNSSDFLNAYVYKCNLWIRLTENVEIIGKPLEKVVFAQAVAVDAESDVNNFYLVGGVDSKFSISKIAIPSDICQLWSYSKYLCRLSRGCSFGTVTVNNTKSTFCFSSDQKDTRKNEGASTFNHGLVCDDALLSQRNCSSFDSCGECEAAWPSEKLPSCSWCQGDSCVKKCIFRNATIELNVNETSTTTKPCPKLTCTAVDCENCLSKPGCAWARQGEQLSCLSNDTALDTIAICPKKCSNFTDCESCLSVSTFEGGFSECAWSTKMARCLSPSYKPLLCSGANCGLLLTKGDAEQCPSSCESHTMCSTCLLNFNCGWCSENGGNLTGSGVCTEGSLDTPISENEGAEPADLCKVRFEALKNMTTNSSFMWNFLTCPPENECLNMHHTCNNKTEKCVDQHEGFACECADGYQQVDGIDECQPICALGCIHGKCVEPEVCECDFGYVGSNCSIQCKCSGHSNCAGPDKLDVCLECKNNTIGKQCEKCDKFYVGDPKDNGKCVSCLEYCNGHTDICVASVLKSYANMSKVGLRAVLTEGSKANAICLNCANQTAGSRCETCMTGYFRGSTNLNDACRKCQCNGHGNTCDAVTGEKCNCGDNSENDNTCPAKLDKNSIFHCWMSQCTKCKESYSGHPKNAHQCYKHITIDSKMCLDAKPLDECKTGAIPLKAGRTVFFVIQPRFMNVDIRIILDVTYGDVDFFMSSNDDSFVVLTNQTNGIHEILLDSKYQWTQEVDNEYDYSENLNITPLVTSSKKSFDNVSIPHGFTDNHGATDCRSYGKFRVLDKVANSLSTYITLNQCNTLLRVFTLRNRLVVTLPQNIHNLSGTRFYIALRAANNSSVSGLLFFRQDQLHIDLFVFFSVFFSCFFLFLSACVVFWKAKQAADLRLARRRHVVEMLNMAQRPYSSVILDTTIDHPESQSNRNISKLKAVIGKKEGNIVPVAIETTSNNMAAVCTVFVRLPGHKRSLVALGSSLINHPKNSAVFLNKPPLRISQQVV